MTSTLQPNQKKTPAQRSADHLTDLETEQAILGTMLQFPAALSLGLATIHKKEIFSHIPYQAIFESIQACHKSIGLADILMVTKQLQSTKSLDLVGGAYAVSLLTRNIVSDSNFQAHLYILKSLYVMRVFRDQSIHTATTIQQNGDPFTVHKLVNVWRKMVTRADVILSTSRNFTTDELAVQEIKEIESDIQNKNLPGLSTGFPTLDKAGMLLFPGNMIILAARPGMGKSALAFQICSNIADAGHKVHFYSYEMSRQQLIQRYISMKSKIDSRKIQQRHLSPQEIELIKTVKVSKNLTIIDDVRLNVTRIISNIENMDEADRPKLLVIDYLQLMTNSDVKSNNREQEVSEISRSIKLAAKRLGIPIIALSQLSRKVEDRQGKRPRMADLRESGALEQDADVIGFIYREAYYDNDVSDKSDEHLAEVIFDKNRNGSPMTVAFKYIPRYTMFAEEENINLQSNSDIYTAF